jgi:parvulin-like peptidyl-prolyl isomerase
VLAALARRKRTASEQDVEHAMQAFGKELSRRNQKLEDFLSRQDISLDSYKHVVRWQLSWKRYLDQTTNDRNLERYFEAHRGDFDGTRRRVAQILWKPSAENSVETLQRKAAEVKQTLVSGERTFDAAAKLYSEAPTATAGGDIGWISRHEPMSEAFSKAAFQLAANEMSDPVVTEAGVHLIHCLQVEPGNKTWQEVREELIGEVRAYLFRWLADRERTKSTVTLVTE